MGAWPEQVWIDTEDPYIEKLKIISQDLGTQVYALPYLKLEPFVKNFSLKFRVLKEREWAPEELKTFIASAYDPCSCGAAKKYTSKHVAHLLQVKQSLQKVLALEMN